MAHDLFAESLDQKACLDLVNEGDEDGPMDAEVILLARLPKARRRFMAIDKSLRDFLAEVRLIFPDACYYTASGGFNLMLGPSHDDLGQNGQQELVALGGNAQIGDGDF